MLEGIIEFAITLVVVGRDRLTNRFNSWMQKDKGEACGYSDTHNILHVMYNHKRRSVGSLDHNVYIGPGFSVSYAKQMVSHPPRNFQRGHLLVPRGC